MEPPFGRRFAVLTVESGAMPIVDEDGTLLARQELPGAARGERTATYGLSVGRFRSGAWGVVVQLLGRTFLFPLHPHQLK